MSERQVMCKKLNQKLPGLSTPPYPSALGQAIYEQISAQAWDQWLAHQTMLINEYRLSLIDPDAKEFLETEMQRFLFSDQQTMPPGFTPNSDNND